MYKKAYAFTLIELLVVMAIMATSLALVGPLALSQYEKIKAQNEWKKVTTFVEHQRKLAFLNGNSITLIMDGAQITTSVKEVKKSILYLDYVFFDPFILNVNTHGISDTKYISATVNRTAVHYQLQQWTN